MGYIKTEEAIEALYRYGFVTKETIEKNIREIPSIDIVRCKECKYWKWIEWAKESRCTLRNTAFNARADDFCSYGEREGE